MGKKFVGSPHYKNRVSLFENLKLDNESIVFLGDSLTQRNEWREFFESDSVVNRGIDSDTASGVFARLNQILSFKVKKIFLMIGINDLANGEDKIQTLKKIENIIDEIQEKSPRTCLYIQSLLPVNNTYYNHHLDNSIVVDFNSELMNLATVKSCEFINLYSELKSDINNELDVEYTRDGVHLSGLGYKKWVKQIEKYVDL